MALVFWLTFNVVGAWLQGLLETGIDWLANLTDSALTAANANAALHSLIIDGIFNGEGSVLSFLPIIVTLFFFLVSMGKEGSRAYYGGQMTEAKAYPQKNTIETTGAGDTFMGTCLHYVLEYGIENLDAEKLMKMIDTANRAAAIITTRKGALRVMPAWEEIKNL